MELEVRLNFHEHGFTPGKDVSEKELEGLRTQFLQMYNLWATGVNQMQDQINDIWHKYEVIKAGNNSLATFMCQMTMGITEQMDYFDWCERWYKEAAESVDLSFLDTRLRGIIFRDGENPLYGVAFRDHPDWTMDFTMELV